MYIRYEMHIVYTVTVLQQVHDLRPFSVVNMTREGKDRTTFKAVKRFKGVLNLGYHIINHVSHLNELQHFIIRQSLVVCITFDIIVYATHPLLQS